MVDENTGVNVARWLRDRGHEIFSVYEEARGIDDDKQSSVIVGAIEVYAQALEFYFGDRC